MSKKLLQKIEQIELLKETIASLPKLSVDVEKKLWEKFSLEWNYNSNHIEGNTVTYLEAKQFLFKNITTNIHSMREWEELSGHNIAIETIRQWASTPEQPLSETDIRSLHTMMLVKPYWADAITQDGAKTRREIAVGEYKSYPNSVQLDNGEMFHYTDPLDVPAEMKALLEWYRSNDYVHTVYTATDLHYKFIRIHPFDDGNGRMARLLLNYEFLSKGYPPVVIKSVDKKRYILCLQSADSGNLEPFYEFIADCLLWSLELVLKAQKGEPLEEPEDLNKEITLFKKKMKAHKQNNSETLQPEKLKDLVLDQVLNFHTPFLESIILKVRKEFSELFDKIVPHYSFSYSGKPTIQDATDIKTIYNEISDKIIVDTYNNVNFKLHCILQFFNPIFSINSEFSDTFRFEITILNKSISIFIRSKTTVKLKEWNITDTVSDEEREELVKIVIKSIFEQIKNSVK